MNYVILTMRSGLVVIGQVEDGIYKRFYWRDNTHLTHQGPFQDLNSAVKDYEDTQDAWYELEARRGSAVTTLEAYSTTPTPDNVILVDFIARKRTRGPL